MATITRVRRREGRLRGRARDPRRRARHLHRDLPARVVPAGPRDDPGQPRRPPGRRGRRAALPPAPGRLLVRADRRAPASCCTTSATGSPTDGATLTLDLGARADGTHDHRGVFIPPGVAHGFAALTDMTITYLVDGYYNPDDELGVAWDDPDDRGRLGCRRARRCRAATRRTPARRHRAAVAAALRAPAVSRAHPRHRRRRLHRLELRAVRAREHRRRGHRVRRAHVRGQPVDAPRRRRRPALPVREGQHLRSRHARGSDGRSRRRRALRRRDATSTARSPGPTTSSTRTASAPTS